MNLGDQPSFIDIYAGCGGISFGLYNAGWRGIFAIEKSKMAFATLKHNLIDRKKCFDWPSWLPMTEHDIVDVLRDHKLELQKLRKRVDLVAGGPPCQGFSLAGRRNEYDDRNKLVGSYVEFVKLVRPRMLFLENVEGFTIGFKEGRSRGEAYSTRVLRELRDLGYKLRDDLVDFSDFGIPQRRRRYILIGLLDGKPEAFFRGVVELRHEFLKKKGLRRRVKLREAISDLERKHGEVRSTGFGDFSEGIYGKPVSAYQVFMRKACVDAYPDSHRFARHKKEIVERLRFILDNCRRNKGIGKAVKKKFNLKKKSIIPLGKDFQCPTLTTLPDDYIHYSEPRILTVREYARIQSFNDWFEFKDRYTTGGEKRKEEVPRYTQVGNAVPPLFVELSGEVLKAMEY